MLQQRGLTGLEPRSIETLEGLRPLRQTRSSSEQKQKSENERDVDHDGSECMPPYGLALRLG
jgi:ribosomal protein L30/L7E